MSDPCPRLRSDAVVRRFRAGESLDSIATSYHHTGLRLIEEALRRDMARAECRAKRRNADRVAWRERALVAEAKLEARPCPACGGTGRTGP